MAMNKRQLLSILLFLLATHVGAVNYYISPTGDDALDGLTPATAWQSIDQGDQSHANVLIRADTVNILPGTYAVSNSITLQSSGSSGNLIVFRGVGKGKVILNLSNADKPALDIQGSYLSLAGIEITNTRNDGILLNGHFTIIRQCYIHDIDKIGIHIGGTNNVLVGNVIYASGGDGIKNEDSGSMNRIYNNTIHAANDHGIELKAAVTTDRIFNNIITQNKNRGITGPVQNICGFNNVWGNPGGDYVGVIDSAGGISVLPKFVDTAAGRFDLKVGAQEIDAGTPLGYAFNGAAPDMGAKEKYNVYFVSPVGDDSASGKSTATAWRTISRADSLLFPGDTVHVATGTYADSVIISDAGIANDDRIVYLGVLDSVLLNANGLTTGVRIAGDYISWEQISVSDAGSDNIQITGSGVTVAYCRLNGAGRYGLYSVQPVDLTKNVFAFNGNSGVYEVASGGANVYNNTFYSNQHYGFKTDGGLLSITNDIFQGHDSAGVRAGLLNTVTYSMFFANGATASGGALLGLSCLIKNPQLLDPSGGDFFMAQGSPGIDAGTNVGLPYSGSAPDMGAYESGELISLLITPELDTLYADSTYQFTVIAMDSAGLPANPGSLLWSHTFATGTIDNSGLFTPNQIGSGTIIVKSSINSVKDTSIVMHVVAGSLSNLTVVPSRDTVSADSSLQFAAIGTDSNGNPVTDVGSLTWSVLNGIGSIDPAGLFTPTHAGPGFIRVISDLGSSNISDTISVLPGVPAYIAVSPSVNTMIEDSSYQYSATGYDSDSNLVKSLTDSVTWTTTDPGGSIAPGGMYRAGPNPSPPLFYVIANYGSFRDSGTVAIIPSGALNHIRIETVAGTAVNDSTLSTDNDTTSLYCRGYDSGNNLLGDVSVSWSMLGPDSVGRLGTSDGVSAVLELFTPGTGRVVATYSASVIDSTGVITSESGMPARLAVSPRVDSVSADTSIQFSIDEFDADNNLTSVGVVGTWSVIGNIGTISPTGLFSPTLVGNGRVAFTGLTLADTSDFISVTAGALQEIAISPDTTIVSADSVRQFSVSGFDAHGNSQDPGSLSWSLTSAIGSIDSAGLFDAVTTGTARVVVISALGPIDSSSVLEVEAGRPITMIISPDSAVISTDSTLVFTLGGTDGDGNAVGLGPIDWSTLGGIGDINTDGEFIPLTVGSGGIAAVSEIFGIADTTSSIQVTPGRLMYLSETPDSATVKIGDTLLFSAVGYDGSFNLTDVGTLSWGLRNGKGTIDSSGTFIAGSSGQEYVSASSSIDGVTDTSGAVVIEALSITSIPIGTNAIHPGQSGVEVLAFRLTNDFLRDKDVTSISLRNHSHGVGTEAQILAEIDSIYLYVDRDGDSTLDGFDSLIAVTPFTASPQTLTFPPLRVPAGSGLTFLATIAISSFARDGDSLDVMVLPSSDITTLDGTTIDGPDTVNSLGWCFVDGMVASQISRQHTGTGLISPGDSTYLLMIMDLPRNGYTSDSLQVMTIANAGTATNSDFDSLMLYRDNGNDVWNGPSTETRQGRLTFTGDRWTLSGLQSPLTTSQTRFYIAGRLAGYPVNGATISFFVPRNGIEVASGNDGPIDTAVLPIDTIQIEPIESVGLSIVNVPAGTLIPGSVTAPLLVFNLVNNYTSGTELDSLTVTVTATDASGATQLQLDSQIDSLYLYSDNDDNNQAIGGTDSLMAKATVLNGRATFATSGFAFEGTGITRTLSIVAFMSLTNSKNGNRISLSLQDSTDLFFNLPIRTEASYPLINSASSLIDAFPAAAVAIRAIESSPLFGGQSRKIVLDFTLPSNGYSPAVLNELTIANIGTLDEVDALSSIALFADRTGDGFTSDDSLLGAFTASGSNWSISKLACSIPLPGRRFFVVVNVLDKQFNVGTIKIQIPAEGVKYASGTIGPDDTGVSNPNELVVFPSDRVTAFAIPQSSSSLPPGSDENVLLTFALYNGFVSQPQDLDAIRLTNSSHTASSRAYSDYELGSISLYMDTDNDRVFGGDSLVATGSFVDGLLNLNGLNQILPPESLAYFFVVGDVPLDVIDSDSLRLQVSSNIDLTFTPAATVNGDFPLTGGGYLVADGSISIQYTKLAQKARSVSPGDTSITLARFVPAPNGSLTDDITSITVSNRGDADSSDISNMELWLDLNGDDAWQSSDSMIGAFNFDAGLWSVSSLDLMVSTPVPALMIVADIASAANAARTIDLMLPVNGCIYASDNDGPRDAAMSIGGQFTISTSSLRVAYALGGATYSVGQSIPLHLIVTNLLDSAVDGVSGLIVGLSDSSVVTLDSGFAGPVNLGAGESTDFTFYYRAARVGRVSWQLRATAPSLGEYSVIIQTDEITVQSSPSQMMIQFANSIPPSVNRGQTNVFPLNIRIVQPDTTSTTAMVKTDSVTLTVETDGGVPCPASNVFSRMVLLSGYQTLAVIDSVPSQSSVTFRFDSPIVYLPGVQKNLSLLVDIDSSATVASFDMVLSVASDLICVDNNTGLTVPYEAGTSFPMRTATCRVDDPSQEMMVAWTNLLSGAVNFGQRNVAVEQLNLRHPGAPGTSQIQLSSISLLFRDEYGTPVSPGDLFETVRIMRRQTIMGEQVTFDVDSTRLHLTLSSPITLSPGNEDSLSICVDVSAVPVIAGFSLEITDSTAFIVRDLSSGSLINSASDTATLATGQAFPITSSVAHFKQPAESPLICLTPMLPVSVVAGVDSLTLMRLNFSYPVDSGFSSVRIRYMVVDCLDSVGKPLYPNDMFDRIGYRMNGGSIAYQQFILLYNGAAKFIFSDTGVVVTPGSDITLDLMADIEVMVPFDNFKLVLGSAETIGTVDCTDTIRTVSTVVDASCGGQYPLATSTTSIYRPAGRPSVSPVQLPVQVVSRGQQSVRLFESDLTYSSPILQGNVALNRVTGSLLRHTSSVYAPARASDLLNSISLMVDGQVVAVDSLLQGDSIVFVLASPSIIERGSSKTLQIVGDIRSDADQGNFEVIISDSSCLEMSDQYLLTAIYPSLVEGTYPVRGIEVSVASEGLEQSFVNYPNPFNPSRGEQTAISFVLPEDAYVDIDLFSITGDFVGTIADHEFRVAGAHQSDHWSGINDAGREVLPGTYFCRITAHYTSGKSESFRRKVAVLR